MGKMKKQNEDILMFAITKYLIKNDISPYDVLIKNSQQGNNTETWSTVLLHLMSIGENTYKVNEILNADPVKNINLFNKQLKELHNRTANVAFIGGLLCQKWTCENTVPYDDDKHLKEAEQFIENA